MGTLEEKIVNACNLHDIKVVGLGVIGGDYGGVWCQFERASPREEHNKGYHIVNFKLLINTGIDTRLRVLAQIRDNDQRKINLEIRSLKKQIIKIKGIDND